MAEMSSARLEALDRKRKLRTAREEVLKALREMQCCFVCLHLSVNRFHESVIQRL